LTSLLLTSNQATKNKTAVEPGKAHPNNVGVQTDKTEKRTISYQPVVVGVTSCHLKIFAEGIGFESDEENPSHDESCTLFSLPGGTAMNMGCTLPVPLLNPKNPKPWIPHLRNM
jgi:hypothetical protein